MVILDAKMKHTLFNKKRFAWLEKEKIKELRKKTIQETARIQREILEFYVPLNNFAKDNPVSYAILLKSKR
jgi:hypothetical protein